MPATSSLEKVVKDKAKEDRVGHLFEVPDVTSRRADSQFRRRMDERKKEFVSRTKTQPGTKEYLRTEQADMFGQYLNDLYQFKKMLDQEQREQRTLEKELADALRGRNFKYNISSALMRVPVVGEKAFGKWHSKYVIYNNELIGQLMTEKWVRMGDHTDTINGMVTLVSKKDRELIDHIDKILTDMQGYSAKVEEYEFQVAETKLEHEYQKFKLSLIQSMIRQPKIGETAEQAKQIKAQQIQSVLAEAKSYYQAKQDDEELAKLKVSTKGTERLAELEELSKNTEIGLVEHTAQMRSETDAAEAYREAKRQMTEADQAQTIAQKALESAKVTREQMATLVEGMELMRDFYKLQEEYSRPVMEGQYVVERASEAAAASIVDYKKLREANNKIMELNSKLLYAITYEILNTISQPMWDEESVQEAYANVEKTRKMLEVFRVAKHEMAKDIDPTEVLKKYSSV